MPSVDELLKGAQETITVRRVFGEPYEQDSVTIIPAAAVRGGGGGGGDSEGNGGGGFGVQARPVGAYVIKDGDVRWQPAIDRNRMTLGWQVVAATWAFAVWAIGRRLAAR